MDTGKNRKIEEILGSFDNVQRAPAPDFFYTRLKSRMEKEILQPAGKRPRVLRPVFALAALVLVLLINAAVILKGNAGTETTTGDTDTSQYFAAEYNLNDNNPILFDINQDK